MGRSRRKHSLEFELETVKQVVEGHRGFCPSCGTRRMVDTAAAVWLVAGIPGVMPGFRGCELAG